MLEDPPPVEVAAHPHASKVQVGLGRAAASPLVHTLVIAALWRLAVAVWGAFAHFVLAPGKFARFSLIHEGWSKTPLNLALDAAVHVDSFWYASIAQHGYTFSTRHQSSIGFFPFLPILMKLGSLVAGNVFVAGTFVTAISLLVAAALFVEWLEDRGLRDRAPVVVAAMLCFPFALFFGAMYTESLYLALALGVFVAMERNRWGLAAAAAFLLVLTRPTGVIILPVLGLMIYRRRRQGWGPWLPAVAAALGLAAFAAYQWITFGTPFAYAQAQAVAPFSRRLSYAVSDVMLRPRAGYSSVFMGAELVIALAFLALVPLVYRRFGAPYALFVALSVLVPGATGLPSMERYVVVAFPAFALAAFIRRPLVLAAMMTAGIWLLALFTALFVDGYSVF